MKVLILETAEASVERTASLIAEAVKAKPDAVLGLATGGTMLSVYRQLRTIREPEVSFARVTCFNLDEYVGLEPTHPCSYNIYMDENLFNHIDIDKNNCHLPKGNAPDPHVEAKSYEARIKASGGIDLQLLGIGQNGHIGFNEPTSSLGSHTRVKTLTESTRQANRIYFERDEDVPRYAITMGVSTILDARSCVLLATGGNKADAVAAMIEGPVTAHCPASVLQFHEKATIVLDRDAASKLKLRDYYEHVHPGGRDVAFC